MELTTAVIQASIKGDKEEGVPNQDNIEVFEDNNLLIVTISDGLGSSKNSLEGARIACQCVIEEIQKYKLSTNLTILDERIRENWSKEIKLLTDTVSNYRTTNSFIAVIKNVNKIIIGQLGDVLVSIRIDGLFRYFESINKDFSNETCCLGCSRNDKYKLTLYDYGHSFDFLIASDGIADELQNEKIETLHDYLRHKFQNIEASNRNEILYNEIVEFLIQKNNDDKSLVFVWTNK